MSCARLSGLDTSFLAVERVRRAALPRAGPRGTCFGVTPTVALPDADALARHIDEAISELLLAAGGRATVG